MIHVKSGGTITLHTESLHDGNPANLLDSTSGMVLDVIVFRWSGVALEFLDWIDNTFKSLGAVTTLRQSLGPVSDSAVPGVFYRAWTVPTGDYTCGFVIRDTNAVAKNVPQQGAISVGQWADQVDAVETDTQNIQGRLPAALVTGRMDSDVGNIQAGAIDAAAVATDAIDADALATNAVAEIQSGLATGAAQAAMQSDVTDILAGTTVIVTLIERVLGLEHENAFVDNTTFDEDGQLIGARVRIFDSKAEAEAATDGGSEVSLATYTVTSEYEAVGRMKQYRMVKE